MHREVDKKRNSAKTWVKLTVGICYVLTVWLLVLCVSAIVFLVHYSAFSDGINDLNRVIMRELAERDVNRLLEFTGLSDGAEDQQFTQERIQADLDARFSVDISNFLYTIYNAEGEILYSNSVVTEADALVTRTVYSYGTEGRRSEVRWFPDFASAQSYEESVLKENHGENGFVSTVMEAAKDGSVSVSTRRSSEQRYLISATVRDPFSVSDRYSYTSAAVRLIESKKLTLILSAFLLALFSLILISVRIAGAGRRYGDDELYLMSVDRFPLELFVAAIILAAVLPELTLRLTSLLERFYFTDYILSVLFYQFLVLARAVLLLWLIIGLARRWKAKTLLRNSLLYYLLYAFTSMKRNSFRSSFPLLWRITLLWLGLSALELVMMLGVGRNTLIVFWCFTKLLLTILGIILYSNLNELDAHGRALRNGDFERKLKINRLLPGLRQHGDNLNQISSGMKKTIDEQMRSERMKAELITNVSHDIKTPLTSIITYVDLLKKNGLQSEEAPEYLDVLDRQSVRMKKLIDDLVEVSKAATGNIRIEKEYLDVNLLLSQASGEYMERMQARSLELVEDLKPELPLLNADPKLLWRIADNLMNNALKYAQPHTRVYVSSGFDGREISVIFRNVSGQQLNMSPEDLVERFVRGDLARNTEGSGLGLSIARSLTELLDGSFDLSIDGDLFKVTLRFPVKENDQEIP